MFNFLNIRIRQRFVNSPAGRRGGSTIIDHQTTLSSHEDKKGKLSPMWEPSQSVPPVRSSATVYKKHCTDSRLLSAEAPPNHSVLETWHESPRQAKMLELRRHKKPGMEVFKKQPRDCPALHSVQKQDLRSFTRKNRSLGARGEKVKAWLRVQQERGGPISRYAESRASLRPRR